MRGYPGSTGVATTPGPVVLSKSDDRRAAIAVGSTPMRPPTRTPGTHELHAAPISPADETALIEFHDRCSETTRYLRFAAAKPQLRPTEAHYLCGVDDHCRGALVIIESDDPGTIHGVGRWERVSFREAELAFVIEDAYQGQGLGRTLIVETIERARDEGFTRLVTDVLPSNYRMRRLARDYDLVIAEL